MATPSLLDQVAKVMIPQESVLVALSGGADSVALLASLVELGHKCVAFHCNYGLRGEESYRDERHAVEIASNLGVNIEVLHCDVESYRSTHPGMSVEMACREMRYNAFKEALVKYHLDSIAIGHHLEDNIETLMLNLLRGSGVKGLAAMKSRRGNILRPLIGCTKKQILEYLTARKLSFITDSSNLSCDYRRNALRNEIHPLIKRYFPDYESGMIKTLSALGNQRSLLGATINEYKKGIISTTGAIDLTKIIESGPLAKEILFELLNYPDYQGFNTTIIDNILGSYQKSGLFFSGTNSTYLLDRGKLIPVNDKNKTDEEIELFIDEITSLNTTLNEIPELACKLITREEFKPIRDTKVAYFDYDALKKCKKIILRHPRVGDRLQPWGMRGSKLLSDIFTDLHYSILARQASWIMEADGNILWLIGIRASRHFAVTPETVSILQLTVNDQ